MDTVKSNKIDEIYDETLKDILGKMPSAKDVMEQNTIYKIADKIKGFPQLVINLRADAQKLKGIGQWADAVITTENNLKDKEWKLDTEILKPMEEKYQLFAEMKKNEAILAQKMVEAIEEAIVVVKKDFKVKNKKEFENDKIHIKGKIETLKKDAEEMKNDWDEKSEKAKKDNWTLFWEKLGEK